MSMRIAVAARSADRVGGAEVYLHTVLPRLVAAGHDVALCLEIPSIGSAGSAALLPVRPDRAALGFPEVAAWRPDVMLINGLLDSRSEEVLLRLAPGVLLAHAYRGTCVSGTKTWSWPRTGPCERTLGWGCLAHYFPRRCGGRSPVTLGRDFANERHRQRLLPRYGRVLALSAHMREECVRNGAADARAFVLPYFAPAVASTARPVREPAASRRLLFIGRMERLKGGDLLLDALPTVRRRLGIGLEVTFVGDGRSRLEWEARAARIQAANTNVSVHFTGWLDEAGVEAALATADLLVMPSRWPEPFGLVGTEAAAHGVPCAAFAVGGIPEWLEDGVTGHLAAVPATAGGLAGAIVRCLEDPDHLAALGRAARRRACEHPLSAHMEALVMHLEAAVALSPRAVIPTPCA